MPEVKFAVMTADGLLDVTRGLVKPARVVAVQRLKGMGERVVCVVQMPANDPFVGPTLETRRDAVARMERITAGEVAI